MRFRPLGMWEREATGETLGRTTQTDRRSKVVSKGYGATMRLCTMRGSWARAHREGGEVRPLMAV